VQWKHRLLLTFGGFRSARWLAFYRQPVVSTLPWLRMIPDTIFIAVGALPLVTACRRGAGRGGGRREPSDYRPAATVLRRTPMPSMSTSTTSPAAIFLVDPGVPV
jgi:hypothetical protein